MVTPTVNGQHMYIDGILKDNLDFVKKQIKNKDEMHIGIVDGWVGTGKSTFVDQLAWYCSDGNFSLKDKFWTVDGFAEWMKQCEKGQANNNVVLDEAFELSRKKSRSEANYQIWKLLSRMRSKKVFVWLCLPYVFDLDEAITRGLVNILLHCYCEYDYGPKGRFLAYNRHKMYTVIDIFNKTKKRTYPIMPNFYGRFTQKFISSSYEEYDRVKNKTLDTYEQKEKQNKKKYFDTKRNQFIYNLRQEGKTQEEIARVVGLTRQSVSYILNTFRTPQE